MVRRRAVFLDRDGIITRTIQRWERFFEDWDVLLTPVVPPHAPPKTPFEIDGVSVPSWRVDHFLYWFSYTGHPALVVPGGLASSGLPIGLQCVGRRWGDEALLAAAETIDSVIGAYQRPPGY